MEFVEVLLVGLKTPNASYLLKKRDDPIRRLQNSMFIKISRLYPKLFVDWTYQDDLL